MRALVDMNEDQVEALDALAKRTHRSRAALIRSAIEDYITRHRRDQVEGGFGLWTEDGGEDGRDYQDRMRSEW